MKALFKTTPNVIEAAADRAGIKWEAYIGADIYYTCVDHVMSIATSDWDSSSLVVTVTGSPNEIMRVIGALADDGQDCLMYVS